LYCVDDKVVCPAHGAGRIVAIEEMEVLGRRREYLTIQILHNQMTVMLPVESADGRLRKVIASDAVDRVLEILRNGTSKMPEKWHARSKRIQEKLGTGDVLQVAEVVRDLALRHARRELPVGEKQVFARARRILASELMYARDLTQEEAEALLQDVLEPAQA